MTPGVQHSTSDNICLRVSYVASALAAGLLISGVLFYHGLWSH